MDDVESILISHYNAVRTEIVERIKLRDQYLVYFAAIAAAAFGTFLKDSNWWGFLLTIPVIAFLASMLYAHTDIIIGDLAIWLKTDYSKSLDQLVKIVNKPISIPHWDGSQANVSLYFSLSFTLRYISISGFLFGSSFLSTMLVEPFLQTKFGHITSNIVLIFNLISFSATAIPLIAWGYRRYKFKPFRSPKISKIKPKPAKA